MNQEDHKSKNPRYRRMLVVDIIMDPQSRPIAIWALAMVFIGTIVFRYLEGWAWVDAFYFSVISLTTVGYGDFVPTDPLTKVLSVIYILSGIGMLFSLIDVIATKRLARRTGTKIS